MLPKNGWWSWDHGCQPSQWARWMFLKMPYLKSARKTEKQQPEDTFLVEFLSEMSHKRGVYQYYTLCTLHLTRWRKKEWCDVQHVVVAMVFRYLCPNAGT